MADFDPNALFGVKGLVAAITGGGTGAIYFFYLASFILTLSKGIGLMIAQALEANGATVYILGRRQEALDKAAGTAKHGNIHPIRADVTSKEDLSAAVSHIASKTGYINLLVANSGITGPTLGGLQQDPKPSITQFADYLWKMDANSFNQTYEVNNTAVFYTIAAFLELLDKGNKKGNVEWKSQVIATASAGAFNRVPMAGYAYGSSKAGVVHMMKQFATTLVPYDIRSNVIAPGRKYMFQYIRTGSAVVGTS